MRSRTGFSATGDPVTWPNPITAASSRRSDRRPLGGSEIGRGGANRRRNLCGAGPVFQLPAILSPGRTRLRPPAHGDQIAARLEALKLGAVERIAAETYAEPDRFFSYRRSCHLAEPDYGRQLTAIRSPPAWRL